MTRSFTVIQGGRSDEAPGLPQTDAAGPDPDSAPNARPDGDWRVDLHRAGSVDGAAVAAWRALMTRNAVADPHFSDPDYLLTAARHQSRGRPIAFALAWVREERGDASLHGVLPLAMPHPIWGRARARPWHPPGLPPASALIDGGRADAVEAAIRGRLAELRRPLRLDALPRLAGRPEARRPTLVAVRGEGWQTEGLGCPRRIPAGSVVGVRPTGYRAPAEVERFTDPVRIDAALEAFLTLDAQNAPRPIIADPSEASMVRVVTRLFARRGQMRIDLARRAGEVVAATLHLGAGARMVAWRHAARA